MSISEQKKVLDLLLVVFGLSAACQFAVHKKPSIDNQLVVLKLCTKLSTPFRRHSLACWGMIFSPQL